uniref:Uncharacterized protein n=1 Tax=Amphimedon queenslandica TaxID=400682 RepID=A0A1X7TFB2_AMPQE
PEEDPPVPWWNSLCDVSLLVGMVKHGYEQFRQWRSDRSLCFWELVGEQQQQTQQQSTPQTHQSKKKRLSKATPSKDSFFEGESEGEEELFELDDDEIDNPGGEESDEGSPNGPQAPQQPKLTTVIRKVEMVHRAIFSVVLVLLWDYLMYVHDLTLYFILSGFHESSFLFFSLFGLLADVWIGRYKAILIGIVLCFISWIIGGIRLLVYQFYSYETLLEIFYFIGGIFQAFGFLSFRANIIQYNIDQFVGASADELMNLHKYPENCSALTYWEEEAPSRLDLGKDKYGGPFTEEEVEDCTIFTRFPFNISCLCLMLIYLFFIRIFLYKYIPISLEFTVAQSPVHMRGVMVGLWYASWGIGYLIIAMLKFPFDCEMFVILAKRYKYCVRENEVNIVQIVDDHYQRFKN